MILHILFGVSDMVNKENMLGDSRCGFKYDPVN